MSQNGNLFKGLIGNTGNNGQGMSPYNAQGSMAAMTGYGGNCPPLQGMSISKPQSSSMGYGMNPVQNPINPVQPFMVRPLPTTGVGTLMTPVPEVIDTTSRHPTSSRPSSIATTTSDNLSGVSNTVFGEDNKQMQSNVNSKYETNAISGQITAQISTKQPSLFNGNSDIPYQNLRSDENVTSKNLSDNQLININNSSLKRMSDNERDLSNEQIFPLAVSFGCLFS